MATDQSTRTQEADSPSRGLTTVFWITIGLTVAFVAFGLLLTDPFGSALRQASSLVIDSLGWAFLLLTMGFLIFALYLAFSRYGKIRLGGPDEKPEFGLFAWFCMLFQAGMGIGLIFWGVSEPLLHYDDPPFGLAEPKTPEAADLALQYSFFHWTLHPWGIYAVVGLAVAYLSYNKGVKDLRISRALRPLLGDRIEGPIGAAIDVIAIVATLFGVAVSLGLGTLQLDAGLGEAFGAPSGIALQLVIIAVTAVGYMLSASTPIEKGINWLSQASMVLAALMLVVFFVLGPSILQLNSLTEGTGRYLGQLIPTSLRMSAFDPDPWLGDWTVFFWATWIAWAPYVGVFIARISRGRTIREFILGVLIAPSLFSVIWFSVFGATALDLDDQLGGALSAAATKDEAVALFTFLEEFPLVLITSALFIVLIWIFFVAGADAGTVVLGSMSTGGALDPNVFVRLVWGAVMAALAAILLVAGGLGALQNGAILAATPFTFIMVALCWSLQRTLAADHREQQPGNDYPSEQPITESR
ncbi:MAG: BCCT family transporter [Actinomycetota bacterium]|nr:BCCT family transporter [Actinomycetota bacterium]